MPSVPEILNLIRALSSQEQEQLVRALTGNGSRGTDLPLAPPAAVTMTRPDVRDPVGWRKAEAGHAVLAIETPERDEEIPAGPRAIAGIWAGRSDLAHLG